MEDCTKFAQPEDDMSLCTWCLCICLILCTITAVTLFVLFIYKPMLFNSPNQLPNQQPIQQPSQEPIGEKKDCAAICAANKDCKGYVYDSIAKTCLLKLE